MDSSTDGKRVLQKSGMPKGAKIAVIVAAVLLAALVGAYFGICAYVNAGARILPNTMTLGVRLDGMTREEAEQAVREAIGTEYAGRTLRVACTGFEGVNADVPGALVDADAAGIAEEAFARGRENGFPGMGLAWISAHFQPVAEFSAEPTLAPDADETLAALAQTLTKGLDSSLNETTWSVTETALVLHKGTSGLAVTAEMLAPAVLDAFRSGQDSVSVTPEVTAPQEPDFEAVYRELYIEPADAYLDKETKEIVPSVTGLSFDIAAARALLERADEDGTATVPLERKEPAMTTEKLEENLFKDVLGKSSTRAAGPNSRWDNIRLAASFVNGVILLPGETFSYTDHCGPYEASKGYGKAGAYVQGKTVDTTAGGICQLSSTLYWTTLKANLETVERQNHRYDVGYLPTGLDATVYGNYPDFKFKNSTDYPIKIETYLDNSHYLHVTIYGTDTTGIHGEPYSILLETIPGKIVYEANAAKVAPGGEPVKDGERTLYNGKRVETHQKLVDKDGNVVSDKVIHNDKYAARDGVYFYHPDDAARLGIDPATGLRNLTPVLPSPEPTEPVPSEPVGPIEPVPGVSPTPSAEPSQDPGTVPTEPVTPPPSETLPVVESPAVTDSPPPEVSPAPTPSGQVPDGIPPIVTPSSPPAA